jgi:MFS family permease
MDVFRRNWSAYIPMLLRQVGAHGVWAIYPLFLEELGATKFWIAIINSINNGTQVLTMRLADRMQPSRAFAIGLIASSLVFAYHGLATQYWQILPIQVVLAISWAGLWVGASNLLLRAGTEKATSMGILYSANSFSQVLGPIVGGNVSQAFGFRPLMFLASVLSLAGLGLRWRLKRGAETAR